MTDAPLVQFTDKSRLGMSTYELDGTSLRCHGRYWLGHSFDVRYELVDLKVEPQVSGLRHPAFVHFFAYAVLGALAALASLRWSEDPKWSEVPGFLFAMSGCALVAFLWAWPREKYHTYVLRDYRPAFSVRAVPQTAPFIETLRAAIERALDDVDKRILDERALP